MNLAQVQNTTDPKTRGKKCQLKVVGEATMFAGLKLEFQWDKSQPLDELIAYIGGKLTVRGEYGCKKSFYKNEKHKARSTMRFETPTFPFGAIGPVTFTV